MGCHSVQIMHAAPRSAGAVGGTGDYPDADTSTCNTNDSPYDIIRYAPGRSVFNRQQGAGFNPGGANGDWNNHMINPGNEYYNPCSGGSPEIGSARGTTLFKNFTLWNWGSDATSTQVAIPVHGTINNFEALPGLTNGTTYSIQKY